VPYAYNRKEAKDHGEGGTLVGAPVRGRVLIIDDVMSAGTAVRESIAVIQAAGATPHAVAIALDRQEKATENGQDVAHSAVQYVRDQLGCRSAPLPSWPTCSTIWSATPARSSASTMRGCWPTASGTARLEAPA
jgi:orotate phosphoribosyltransferase